jgi:DNA-binding FadR family transcriptional regulator
LAAAYGVTRTSLKHALVRLVQAGLLETRHGVGTRARDYARHAGPDLLPMLVAHAGPDWLDLLGLEPAEARQVAERLRGVRGVYVADAATLPTCPEVNP